MARITYIEFTGKSRVVDVKDGWSVMRGAVQHGVPGIVAECGGACACATCHVYVDDAWKDRLQPMQDLERDMIEFALDLRENSRLACQIQVKPELDGLIVRMPEAQNA